MFLKLPDYHSLQEIAKRKWKSSHVINTFKNKWTACYSQSYIWFNTIAPEQQLKDPPNDFILKLLKKTTEYFLKFLFLFVSTIRPVNNGE